MPAFVDNAGRTWAVTINVAAIKRVKALLDIHIPSLVDGKFESLAELIGDPITLCDVLYVLCKDQADRDNITDEQFGQAMFGDALGNAADAFLGALADFFQSPRVRAAIGKIREVNARMEARMNDLAIPQILAIDAQAEVERLIGSSGSSPGSSASTPDPSHSAN